MRIVRKLRHDERGATLIEYSLILALVFLVIVGSVQVFAGKTVSLLNTVSNKVVNAG